MSGAINAAIIGSNPVAQRLERLQDFWRNIESAPSLTGPLDGFGMGNMLANMTGAMLGIPGFSKAGPLIKNDIDDRIYAKGRRVSDQGLAEVHVEPHDFHGEWNYTIHPKAPHNKPNC